MRDANGMTGSDDIVATIENTKDPTQRIALYYLREENAFVTSGIQHHFGEKEILIPAHLVIMDSQLIGSIISAILENQRTHGRRTSHRGRAG